MIWKIIEIGTFNEVGHSPRNYSMTNQKLSVDKLESYKKV
jgi:hypothetical protein